MAQAPTGWAYSGLTPQYIKGPMPRVVRGAFLLSYSPGFAGQVHQLDSVRLGCLNLRVASPTLDEAGLRISVLGTGTQEDQAMTFDQSFESAAHACYFCRLLYKKPIVFYPNYGTLCQAPYIPCFSHYFSIISRAFFRSSACPSCMPFIVGSKGIVGLIPTR